MITCKLYNTAALQGEGVVHPVELRWLISEPMITPNFVYRRFNSSYTHTVAMRETPPNATLLHCKKIIYISLVTSWESFIFDRYRDNYYLVVLANYTAISLSLIAWYDRTVIWSYNPAVGTFPVSLSYYYLSNQGWVGVLIVLVLVFKRYKWKNIKWLSGNGSYRCISLTLPT